MQADDQAAPGATGWGEPFLRFDAAWQRLEARVCTGVLVAEIACLTLWVFLRGFATSFVPGQSAAGLLCRSMVSTAVFGAAAHLASRRRTPTVHRIVVTASMLVGVISGAFWVNVGVTWSSNLLNWLQNASVLMLIGGLRGLATRLTFWVAFLGASMASSSGKHIHVDVLLRYIPSKLRLPTAILGWLGAAVVCGVAVCGFVDYIAIAAYQVNANQPCPTDSTKECDTPVGEKLAIVAKEASAESRASGDAAAGCFPSPDRWRFALISVTPPLSPSSHVDGGLASSSPPSEVSRPPSEVPRPPVCSLEDRKADRPKRLPRYGRGPPNSLACGRR